MPSDDEIRGVPTQERWVLRAIAGIPDTCRRGRWRRRVVQFSARIHPEVKGIMALVQKRDGIPNQGTLLERMLDAYLKEHGQIDASEL